MKRISRIDIVIPVIIIVVVVAALALFPAEMSKDDAMILDQFRKTDTVRIIVRLKENKEIGSYLSNEEYYDKLSGEIVESITDNDILNWGLLAKGFAAEVTLNGFYALRSNPNIESIVLSSSVNIDPSPCVYPRIILEAATYNSSNRSLVVQLWNAGQVVLNIDILTDIDRHHQSNIIGMDQRKTITIYDVEPGFESITAKSVACDPPCYECSSAKSTLQYPDFNIV
jgi:hypothetical protein